MRIRTVDEREDRLHRHQKATGEKMKAGAIDVAVKHYLNDLRNKELAAPELDDELAETLSTPWLPIERETVVGLTNTE